MQQITVTNEKQMTVAERKAAMPYELLADGTAIGTVSADYYDGAKIKTKCPNCGLLYDAQKLDGKPGFFAASKIRPKVN